MGSMSRRRRVLLWAGAIGAVVLAVALALFQPWLLWVDEEVHEEIPEAAATETAGLDSSPTPPAQRRDGSKDQREVPEWTVLAVGDFIDAEHGTSGTARVVRNADGSRQLWIEGLDTSNGPDLHVWLTDQQSGGGCDGCFDSWGIYDDGDYVRLGELKGNQGDQRYDIPDDADLGGMRSVVIWCDRFNVAFGTARIA